nr:MAG TPA: hypothetical protein [Caudoviricetes sp.]
MFKHKLFFFDESANAGTSTTQDPQPNSNNPAQSTPAIDYEKIASIVEGKQKVAEDTVLKNYFKNQGLTGEEMAQAISSFKSQKASAQPDVASLQEELRVAQAQALQTRIESNLQLAAMKQGVGSNVLPYVLKLADSTNLTLDSKNEDYEAVIAKVLEDVPAFKPEATASTGFTQVGSTGDVKQSTTNDELLKIFGV